MACNYSAPVDCPLTPPHLQYQEATADTEEDVEYERASELDQSVEDASES